MLLLAPVLYPQREMEVCQLIPKHVLCNIHTVEDRKITVCKTVENKYFLLLLHG